MQKIFDLTADGSCKIAREILRRVSFNYCTVLYANNRGDTNMVRFLYVNKLILFMVPLSFFSNRAIKMPQKVVKKP